MSSFQIVGVLNVTPDSYFEGSRADTVESAVLRAGEMLQEGAHIIEIGGESTGPGSQTVDEPEELRRTITVIKAIKESYPEANIAIDTYKAEVARQAVSAGVMMINDVTAGRGDPDMFPVLAESACRVVLMYAKDSTPRTTVEKREYDNVLQTIRTFLEERVQAAEQAGIDRKRLCIDPGMGHFISSDAQYSYQVLCRLQEFQQLDLPLFLSPSRKSFLAGTDNVPTAQRLPGTIAASAIAVLKGAQYIRTHDVLAVARGCEVAEQVRACGA